MSIPVLFHDPTSEPSRAVHWLALEIGVPIRLEYTWLGRGDHRRPALLAVNPRHQVPALQHGDLRLSEATAIMRYLAEIGDALEPWFGATAQARANIELRLSWHHTHTRQVTLNYTVPMVLMPAYHGRARPGATAREKRRSSLREHLDQLAAFLAGSPYVALTRITAADLFIASDLFELDADPERDALLKEQPLIEEWLGRLRERPGFADSARVWNALAREIRTRLEEPQGSVDSSWAADLCERLVRSHEVLDPGFAEERGKQGNVARVPREVGPPADKTVPAEETSDPIGREVQWGTWATTASFGSPSPQESQAGNKMDTLFLTACGGGRDLLWAAGAPSYRLSQRNMDSSTEAEPDLLEAAPAGLESRAARLLGAMGIHLSEQKYSFHVSCAGKEIGYLYVVNAGRSGVLGCAGTEFGLARSGWFTKRYSMRLGADEFARGGWTSPLRLTNEMEICHEEREWYIVPGGRTSEFEVFYQDGHRQGALYSERGSWWINLSERMPLPLRVFALWLTLDFQQARGFGF